MIQSVTHLDENQLGEHDEASSLGALETCRGRLPLTDLSVKGRIANLAAEVTVQQTYRNSLDESLEATYIFPLPDRAAVTGFHMQVKDRVIEGQLKERGKARADYQKAIQKGHRAGIAEEERSGVFTLRVGNLPPREEIVVTLTLVQPIPVSDGEATFRFPLVVAPRYTPGVVLDGPSVGAGRIPDTDQVPDASRVTPPVLLPGFPNPVRLSLEVEFARADSNDDAGEWMRGLRSSLHSVISDDRPWVVKLQPGERLDRDFILRYPIASPQATASLVVDRSSDGKPDTLALTVVPPMTATATTSPRRVVFLLDRSGSMSGWKMVAARRAMGRLIDTLLDQDEFAVWGFDNQIVTPPHGDGLVPATNRERFRAIEWLATLDANGGTEMQPAIEKAVALLHPAPQGRIPILVIVTDGQVSGEDIILRSVCDMCGGAVPKIFAVGIDQAVNAGFLRRLADLGRGDCELVESEDRLDEAMDRIHRFVGSPSLTQLRIEPLNFAFVPDSLAPCRLPDVYTDRPVTIHSRCHLGELIPQVRIHAVDQHGQPWQQAISGQRTEAPMLRSLWGRARVRDLEDLYAASGESRERLAEQIVSVSLESRALSRFTAYVAVDESEVVNPSGEPLEIVQPVELPAGWDADLADTGVHLCVAASPSSPMLGQLLQRARSATPRYAMADQREATRSLSMLELLNRAVDLGAWQIRLERDDQCKSLRVSYLVSGQRADCISIDVSQWKALLKAIRREAGASRFSRIPTGEFTCQFTFRTGKGDVQVRARILNERTRGVMELELHPSDSVEGSSPDCCGEPRPGFWK